MPSSRLTDRWLKAHRPSAREEWSDELVPGLAVRFGISGPVFYVRHRDGAKVRRHRLGAFPGLGLRAAREKARAVLAAKQRGAYSAAPGTYAELLEEFLRSLHRKGEATAAETERVLRANTLPAWEGREAGSIRPRDVAEVLDAAIGRGAPVQANRIRAHLVRLFRWGMERELVEVNPALVVRKPHRERARERVLEDSELAALWRGLELKHPTLRNLFRLLILTGLRPSEARLLRWSDVGESELRIPAERTKARRDHRLPLAPLALRVLQDQGELGLVGEMVFPSPRNGPQPLDLSSLSHLARGIGKSLGFEFRPHDLRRTCASGLARLKASREVVRRVLNHADPEVTGRYDRHAYSEEMRKALGRWSAHVQALLANSVRWAPQGQLRSPATHR